MLTTIGEPLFVPPQILCDPSKLWSFSSLPPLTTTTQPLQHTLFFPCSRHHHHLQALFFFFFVLLIPLHQIDCVQFTPTAHFLLSDRFFKCLDCEKKPSSCLPRSSRTSLRRRRPRRRIRLVFSIIPCLFSVVFKGRRLTFISLIDLWYEKRTYRKPPST